MILNALKLLKLLQKEFLSFKNVLLDSQMKRLQLKLTK